MKPGDLDFENAIGWVRNGKGGKDRPFIIPQKIIHSLKKLADHNQTYLFNGRNGSISTKSAQIIVANAGKKAGIKKHVHPHMLRHSFTTHLLQDDEDIATVQTLLGHVNLVTTIGYSHVARPKLINTKSPLDRLIK